MEIGEIGLWKDRVLTMEDKWVVVVIQRVEANLYCQPVKELGPPARAMFTGWEKILHAKPPCLSGLCPLVPILPIPCQDPGYSVYTEL